MPRQPEPEHGRFLRAYLDRKHLKPSEVARRLRVSAAMFSRLTHGLTKHFTQITEPDLARAAGFDTMTRRTFVLLLADAGITLATARPAAMLTEDSDDRRGTKSPGIVRNRHIDLDFMEAAIGGWSAALSRNYSPEQGLAAMQIINKELVQACPTTADARSMDPRYIAARVHSGMLLAALQEAVLPWRTERPAAALRTYGDLERTMFGPIADSRLLTGFEEDYARLLIRRAVLLRESELADRCEGQLARIPRRLLDAGINPVVRVAFETQALHTHALIMAPNPADIADWRRRAEAIRMSIDKLRVSAPEEMDLQRVVDYTIGVGYKSVMWKLHLRDHRDRSAPHVEEYAREARQWLGALSELGQSGGRSVRYINLYHPSVSDELSAPELAASELDVLVWCDPEAALMRANAIEREAREHYPSVLAKVGADVQLARWRLGRGSLPVLGR